MRRLAYLTLIVLLAALPQTVWAQQGPKWVVSWAASVQGPYPVGNPSAQPDQKFAFPAPEAGARDQTFRLIVQPEIWGKQARLRFSNALRHQAGHVRRRLRRPAARQRRAGAPARTGRSRSAASRASRSRPARTCGATRWRCRSCATSTALAGRKLAVSFHVAGESGPMTWHAKALQTSYVTAPGAGSKGQAEDEAAFPFRTASWFFLDAVDMMAPADTQVIVAFGDSITDGTASTMNGDDRWPNVLSRRLHAARQPRRGGQRRHRRQPGGRAAGVFAAEAVPGRAVGRRRGSSATC